MSISAAMGSGSGSKSRARRVKIVPQSVERTSGAVTTGDDPSKGRSWGVWVLALAVAVALVGLRRVFNPPTTVTKFAKPDADAATDGTRRYLDPVPHTIRSIHITAPTRSGGSQDVELLAVDDFLPVALAEQWRDALLEGRCPLFCRSQFMQ